MTPLCEIECARCREYTGTYECSIASYALCSSCLEKNDRDADICINGRTFFKLKKMINTGNLTKPGGLGDILMSSEEDDTSMEIKKEFLSNIQRKMACVGRSGWGYCRQYIYRHHTGSIYTFTLIGFDGTQTNILCLNKYVLESEFPRDFGFDLV
jgi:hypothetical protein